MTETLDEYFERARTSPVESLAYYRLLREQKKLNSVLIYEARCESSRCLLLHVFQTPSGPAFYQPRYKLSRHVNMKESSEDGRRNNTEDGVNHWKEHANLLEFALNLPVNCDHYRGVLALEDLDGEPGNATRARL